MLNYVNRKPQRPVKKPARSVQTGVRIPSDLVAIMDAHCRSKRVKRSALIVSALRLHLNKPDPADIPVSENTKDKSR